MLDLVCSLIIKLLSPTALLQWFAVVTLLSVFYVYNFYKNIIWKKYGVHYLTPLPLVGNDSKFLLGTKTIQDVQRERYEAFGDYKFGGLYNMSQPVLFVKDPDLIETMLTKDFSHFVDRGLRFNEKDEPLRAHLFNLTGKRWKNLRSKLSPVFTSGKLKTMHQQLIDCADVLMEVFEMNAKTSEKIDFKETMAKFTTDVIGTCAYGLNMNSLKDPDNKFRVMGRKIFEATVRRKIQFFIFALLYPISPKIATLIRPVSTEASKFFLEVIPATIKAREENPDFQRNDFVQLLMNLRQQDDKEGHGAKSDEDKVYLDDNMMAANSFLFFIAGFETTASTLTYCLFELAQHPDIQEKLYQEVKDVLAKHDNQPTYEAIKHMTYMEMVVSETLRKYPPVPLLFRVCTESYRIPDTDIVLPKGQRVEIPTYALHHDPNIFPDPEDFQPERFSPENKDSIPKGAYLPFGDGPRICIGARFAWMEIKVCLAKLLSKFKIVKNPDMPDVIEFDAKSAFILIPKGGIYMNIQPRDS